MKVLRFRMNDKNKAIIVAVLLTSFNFVITVVVPFIVYLFISTPLTVERTREITFTSIIIGALITIFIAVTYSLKSFSKKRVILSLIPQILLCIYIVTWSEINSVGIWQGNGVIIIDTSNLFLFLVGIPILVIIRNLYYFSANIKHFKAKMIILDAISNAKKANTKIQISNFLRKNLGVEPELRRYVLSNVHVIMDEMLKEKKPFIQRRNRFVLTERGRQVLNHYPEFQVFSSIEKNIIVKHPIEEEYEEWTEEELEKYAKKRKIVKILK